MPLRRRGAAETGGPATLSPATGTDESTVCTWGEPRKPGGGADEGEKTSIGAGAGAIVNIPADAAAATASKLLASALWTRYSEASTLGAALVAPVGATENSESASVKPGACEPAPAWDESERVCECERPSSPREPRLRPRPRVPWRTDDAVSSSSSTAERPGAAAAPGGIALTPELTPDAAIGETYSELAPE
jgi:hypothetical protein